jgi:hypothetical protein
VDDGANRSKVPPVAPDNHFPRCRRRGIGGGAHDRLEQLGGPNLVGVDFGTKADRTFATRRSALRWVCRVSAPPVVRHGVHQVWAPAGPGEAAMKPFKCQSCQQILRLP